LKPRAERRRCERSRRRAGRAFLALALAAGASACTYKTKDSEILPWLKRTDTSTSFGGLGGHQTRVYSTRVLFFFWHELDAYAITVLDADTVLVRSHQGEALLRRGEYTPTPACPAPPFAHVQLPPQSGPAAFDCVSVADRSASGRPTAVRVRRLHSGGEASIDVRVAANGAEQVLLHPFALFYDRKAQPYFVSIAARAAPDFRAPDPDCALIVVENGRTRTLRPPAPLATANDCSLKTAWESAAGTTLSTHHDVEREITAAASPIRRR
jgi:hypothetical protein